MLHICASGGKLSENNIFYSDILWSSCTILRMAASSVLLWQKAAIAGIVVRKNSWIKELKICLLIYSIFILIKLFYTAKQWGRVLNKFSTLNPVWLQLVCQIGKDRFFHIKTTCFCSTHKTFFMNVCACSCVYCIFFPHFGARLSFVSLGQAHSLVVLLKENCTIYIFRVLKGAFQIVAAGVVCEDTNHGPAQVGVLTNRNHSDNLKYSRY